MKILIIRYSSMGDIILTTPVVRCLKKTEGLHVEVHYATKRVFAGMLDANPYVDMVHVFDDDFGDLVRRLWREQFDLVIDLHNNIRSLRTRLSIKKPSKKFRKLNIRKWMLTALKIDRLPDIHIVDRYMETVQHLGVANDGAGLDFFIPEQDQLLPASIPDSFKKAYVAFAIGGKHATKRLPHDKIREVCLGLHLPVVLLGDANDRPNGDAIHAACPDRVFNACGLLSLNQSAAVVKSARLVITHDTGLMHIAAAFKKRIISIWGNTIPKFGMTPYMPGHEHLSTIVQVEDLKCRPCSKIGYDKCPKTHFDCMQKINAGQIIELANG